MSNQRTYNTYRLTFPEFVYESYQYDVQSDGLHISFGFKLSAEAIAFWKKLYFNGLGEFFYVNGIRASEEDFMTIIADKEPLAPIEDNVIPTHIANGYLVPIGGGKDSVVSLELLKEISDVNPPLPLVMNPRGATTECCHTAGYGRNDFIEIQRTIDPLLLNLNDKGALNGHTPFSAMLAFYTLLAAALTGRMHIALSNESSANEATVLIGDSRVNHQYSKSLEFENDFRRYVASFISPQFDYFSLLRPLSELQIAMLFARLPQYHNVFRSCNVGSKEDIWCCHCAKCLFAFIILSPFINPIQLSQIFGHNLLNEPDLKLHFRQLTGLEPTKPFECVGTVAEVHTALRMTINRWYKDDCPILLKDFVSGNYDVSLHELSDEPENIIDIADGTENILRLVDKYDLIVKTPGIPFMTFEGVCNLNKITSQTELFLQIYGSQTIGITGTKGKSTTTELIYEMLSYNVPLLEGRYVKVLKAGNMGIPLFDIVPQLDDSTLVVAELSCHQLEHTSTSPLIAVMLNLYEEHLDHYRCYDDYKLAKLNIALHQTIDDHLFFCTDSDDLCDVMKRYGSKIHSQKHEYSFQKPFTYERSYEI